MKNLRQLIIALLASIILFSCSVDINTSRGIAIMPESCDFGKLNIGNTDTINIEVRNLNTYPILIHNITTLTGSSDFKILPSILLPKTLNTDSFFTIAVEFAPKTAGLHAASFGISQSGSDGINYVSLSGIGIAVARIKLSETSYDFGKLFVGRTDAHDFDIQNTGTADLILSALTFSGSNADNYSITLGELPARITPGATFRITVHFTPQVAGTLPTTLKILHNAENESSPSIITIDGEGKKFEPLLDENFDYGSAPSNWTFSGGVWNWGTPTSGPGIDHTTGWGKCIATNINGNYSNRMSQDRDYVDSPTVDLRGTVTPQLSFWHWYHLERLYDRAYLQFSTNNGASWITITTFDGRITTWTLRTYSLTGYRTSSQFKVRWAFRSDSSATYDGWYVDDVLIIDTATPP